jgi:putative ABC transport system permease protein
MVADIRRIISKLQHLAAWRYLPGRRFWAIFKLTVKRLVAQPALSLLAILGIGTAIALAMSIPIYADAVYQGVLDEKVSSDFSGIGEMPPRPTFAFLFYNSNSIKQRTPWKRLDLLDQYLSFQVEYDLGLPQKSLARFVKSHVFPIYVIDDAVYDERKLPLTWSSFAFASDLQDHIVLLEGSFPEPSGQRPQDAVEVLVHEEVATRMGLQVGDVFVSVDRNEDAPQSDSRQFPVKIAGVWKQKDVKDPYWFFPGYEYKNVWMVHPDTFSQRLANYRRGGIYTSYWYMEMDGTQVHSGDVSKLLQKIEQVQQKARAYHPRAHLHFSPIQQLKAYQGAVRELTYFLLVFSIPILGMLVIFISLVSGMLVGQEKGEIAILRSRGASNWQVTGMAVVEGIFLGVAGFLIGIPLALINARTIGGVRSFLDFSLHSDLRTAIPTNAFAFGLAITCLAVVALVIPTFQASRNTIISYKQERSRQLRKPWWQRMQLDLILCIPVAYGIYLLKVPNAQNPLLAQAIPQDPLENPLLFLIPTLGIIALTLLTLRFLPVLLSGGAWIFSRTRSVSALLASRHLSRATQNYHAPLLLLVLTISLATFTASLAQTLDRHLFDRVNYQTGAQTVLLKPMKSGTSQASPFTGGEAAEAPDYFLPVEEYLKVPGVSAAARLAKIASKVSLNGKMIQGKLIGLDRTQFPGTTFWRADFAPTSLGSMLNLLALSSDGVLIERTFLEKNSLRVGDPLQVIVYPLGDTVALDFRIVGVFDFFPTWYPSDGPLVVANLDYIFEMVGGEFAYDVWLSLGQGHYLEESLPALEGVYRNRVSWLSAPTMIEREQTRPERQGLFGLLTFGLITLALLSIIGFLLYSFFSFRSRFIELGMLRALGLTSQQMFVFLTVELAFLLLVGILLGTALGIGASQLFIPALQANEELAKQIPPMVVQIDWHALWRMYMLFGLLFLAALGGLGSLLLKMKIFQAIKLGESV